MSDLKTVPEPHKVLSEEFGDAIQEMIEFRGQITVVISAEKLAAIAQFCRDHEDMDFKFLSSITSVDFYPEEPRFQVNYDLCSLRKNKRLRLRVMWSDGDEDLQSVTPIWPNADWFEREIYDMMGITFVGHPDLRRILMPDDWDGHPLRKDYPLGYETVQFSFNYDEVNKHKPFAKK